jgi:DNA mismatch repair protein MutL
LPKINILPEKVANQIAAGEVINRPASCVKEMLENSIDAGAGNISITILKAGKKLIEIKDDGAGMDETDCERAFLRHATSKIKAIEDLNYIETMGFRGEALASIASVARVEVISRTAAGETGNFLLMEAGKILKKEKIAANTGTIIRVKDLFYNTPARLKFLKSEYTEITHIMDAVTAIGLSLDGVSVRLRIDDKEVLFFEKDAGLPERIRVIFGREVFDALIPINGYSDNVKVYGYIGKPSVARNNRGGQFLFVNRRNILSKRLNYAVYDGFGTLLMKGKYPVALVFVDINPSLVDVNVHPAKAEVKFKDENIVFNMIKKAIQDALSAAELSVTAGPASLKEEAKQAVEQSVRDFFVNETPALFEQQRFEMKKAGKPVEVRSGKRENLYIKAIGQVNRTYIVGEDGDGLVIIDQHAAHEKVLYEKIIKEIGEGRVKMQEMLIPEVVETTPAEKVTIVNNAEVFRKLGFELEPFGEREFKISAHPVFIREKAAAPFIREMTSLLMEKGKAGNEEVMKGLASVTACRAALKAGDELNGNEIEALLREYFEIDAPYSCPHGRPPIVKIRFDEIEKMFKRKT